ncbi:MAG: LysM peptidoglycan-binding domain-containing protein [Deltaproteobacteria bacterium]|nr:LysM peptidoglycan-binding domain-containing protein [Deltaproteobacteria bacterium]
MEPGDRSQEKELYTPTRKQRFKPSTLEILIGSLIVLGFFYLGYLVLAKEGGDTRKLETRLKALEMRVVQQGATLDQELQGLKPPFQKMETRLKGLEDSYNQLDLQLKNIKTRLVAVTPPPKTAGEEKKPPSAAPGKEKLIHKIKKGENIYSIAKKYHVYVQEILQWNNLPSNSTLKVGDSLIIFKR